MLDFPMEILQRVGQIHLKITASSIEQMRPGQLPRHTSGEAPFWYDMMFVSYNGFI